jgi:hypothetical protein
MTNHRWSVLLSAFGMLVWIGLAKGWPMAFSYLGLAVGLSLAAVFLAFAFELLHHS